MAEWSINENVKLWTLSSFSVLILLAGHQERHLERKKPVKCCRN